MVRYDHRLRAGRSKTARQNGKIVRINAPHSDGRSSLSQAEQWPHRVNTISAHKAKQYIAALGADVSANRSRLEPRKVRTPTHWGRECSGVILSSIKRAASAAPAGSAR
jgi:hypothetical protein